MLKKLLLVSANQMKVPYPVYPLGISYIQSYLAKHMTNIQVMVFDFVEQNYDAYIDFLSTYKPDFIGISLRNVDDVNVYVQESFIKHYQEIVTLSRRHSCSKIILGGAGYSIYPELMFEKIKPDFGIYGEGEAHFYNLLDALINNKDFEKIDNLLFVKNNKLVFNKNVQALKSFSLSLDNELVDYYWQHSGMLNVQTKRGCPYNCIYCTYPKIESHKVRTLNIGSIIDTLTYLKKNKNIDYVFFTDSVFNISNPFNIELAEAIIKNDLDVKWGAYFNFCNLDEKLLGLFKRAGLTHIEFGTDSLSDTTLINYNKPFLFEDIKRISDICVKLHIDYCHFLILAGYGETEITIKETFDNCKKLDKTIFFPFIGMRIYPQTPLHQIALEEGLVQKHDDLLFPTYYISKNVELAHLKQHAYSTGQKWIFPDQDLSGIMNKMRARNKKGPLWEYLIPY